MPFQSEKQRRYLHANHPEIAKRWEKEYAHGGVSTLFRAKDGGRIGFYRGSPHAGGYGTTSSSSNTGGGGHAHPGIASQYSAPSTSTRSKSISEEKQEEFQKQQFRDVTKGTLSDPEEKYDTHEQHMADTPGDLDKKSPQWNSYKSNLEVKYRQKTYENTLANQKAKMKSMGLRKLILPAIMILAGVPPKIALKGITVSPNDLMTAVQHSLPVMKAKKEYIAALENHTGGLLKNVDITNPNEMVNVEETTDFTEKMNELKELTKKPEEEDTKGDGPELPPQLGGPSTEEMATEYYATPTMWRDNQALYAQLSDKWEQEKAARDAQYAELTRENPMGTDMNIIAIGNKGGLANLFRVKKQ